MGSGVGGLGWQLVGCCFLRGTNVGNSFLLENWWRLFWKGEYVLFFLLHSLKLTNRTWKDVIPKGNEKVFQASIPRGELLVSGRVIFVAPNFANCQKSERHGGQKPNFCQTPNYFQPQKNLVFSQ